MTGPSRPDLDKLVNDSIEAMKTMTTQQRSDMLRDQARSYVLGEAGIGSDKDEAEYRAALMADDHETLARLDREASERVRTASKIIDNI
jgi:hypothetical protein